MHIWRFWVAEHKSVTLIYRIHSAISLAKVLYILMIYVAPISSEGELTICRPRPSFLCRHWYLCFKLLSLTDAIIIIFIYSRLARSFKLDLTLSFLFIYEFCRPLVMALFVPVVISPLVFIVQKESIIIKSFREIRSKSNKPEKQEIKLRQLSKPKLVSVQFWKTAESR